MYKTVTTTFAALALLAGGAAFAQQAHASADPSASMQAKHAQWHKGHEAHMQKKLSQLKSRLDITSQQESAWNGFTQAAENMHTRMHSEMKSKSEERTVPQIFDRMAKRAQERARKVEKLDTAAKNLYGKLSSKQKAAWNQAMQKMRAKMHRRWHKHHGARSQEMNNANGHQS